MTLHHVTPYRLYKGLTAEIDLNVYVKLENIQPSGSFKLRGIGKLCENVAKNNCVKLVCSSGGNAGLAAAYAANKLGKPIDIYTPESTPAFILDKLKSEGANVIVRGKTWDDCNKDALIETEKPGHVYIPPFDHPDIWDGHSSMIIEIYNSVQENAQLPRPDVIICSVGGGGLLCGIVQGLKKVGWLDIPVVTVETEGADSFYQSVNAGELVTLPSISSIAKTLGARTVGKATFETIKQHVIIPCVVTDKDAVNAIIRFLDDEKMLVEPACSVSLAVLYNGTIKDLIKKGKLPADTKNIAVIVCGGSGIKHETIVKWKKMFNL